LDVLGESKKFTVKILVPLVTDGDPSFVLSEFIYPTDAYSGLGHAILRSSGRCTTVQLYLEDFSIEGETATCIYQGYTEKNFSMLNITMDVSLSFMLSLQKNF